MTKALIVVDVQNDFCPGGALEVPNGDQVVEIINKIRDKYNHVIFTFDSHKEDHCSFKENNGIWPKHCVINTNGHNSHPKLNIKGYDFIVSKGTDSNFDSYSAFKDDNGKETILPLYLNHFDIKEVDICGLASEYCVAFTAQDAIGYKLKTTIITDACRCIDKKTEQETFSDLKNIGVNFKTSSDI